MKEPFHLPARSENEKHKEITNITGFNNGAKQSPFTIINNIVRREGVMLNERIWSQLEKTIEKNWEWNKF